MIHDTLPIWLTTTGDPPGQITEILAKLSRTAHARQSAEKAGIFELTLGLKFLVIAHDFPPGAEVGGKRPASFCRYLPEHDIQPIVLTVDPKLYGACDATLAIPSGIRIERTGMLPDLLKWYRFFRPRTGPGSSELAKEGPAERARRANRRFISALRQNILHVVSSYYAYLRWFPHASRASDKLVKHEVVAAVLSTGPPWVAHLIARRLKRKHGLPWLADFRDAWGPDVWRPKGVLGWQSALARRLEAICVENANLVICNTERMRKDFIQSYPGLPLEKFVTLTNGYNDVDPVRKSSLKAAASPIELADASQSVRVLLHLGSLHGGRRVDTLCRAIDNLIESGSLDQKSVKVLFQGDADPSIVSAAERVAPELISNGCVQFRPRVGWQEAQRLLERAGLLLIIQGNHPAIPAKFYEYLRTGKPIFAIVQQGPLSEILEETAAGLWADPRDPEGIATKLLKALALPRRSPDEVRRVAGRYHYRALTEQLAQWVWQLATARTDGRRAR